MNFISLIKFIVSLSATVVVLIALNTRFGQLPEIGPFMSPFEGFWQLAEGNNRDDEHYTLTGLADEVSIHYDDDGIPHIFAQSDVDLYTAQGFLVARERLWQMEFMAMAASGRLTEIAGEEALGFSQYMRNLGMVIGAERAAENMMANDQSRAIVEAYTDGVNQYIDQLESHDLPVEFRLLGHEPEEWTPKKTALVLMNVSETLTANSDAHQMTNTLDLLGEAFINRFFPKYADHHEYYIPNEGQFDFEPLTASMPDSSFTPRIMEESPAELPQPGIGSNNWAVHGSRTTSGSPMMSNDPHLGLSLPSIWIEMQLHTPEMNVYGVSLPGTPGIIIGFNEAVSWGLTNAGSLAMDIFEIEFRDDDLSEYYHDGEWKPVEKREQIYEMPDGSTVTDTLLLTHHGPITTRPDESPHSTRTPAGHAVKWTAHNPGNELLAVYKFNNASDVDDFQEALHHFHVPAQSPAFADSSGNIAQFHHGRYPVRWESQGDFISDGRDPAYEWQDDIPMDQTPRVINPQRGFTGSANQPAVGEYYPYNLGWHYATNERGVRIHELLEAESSVDPAFMKDMIHDDLSVEARRILPHLLEWLEEDQLSTEQLQYLDILVDWDYRYHPGSQAPFFFDQWWQSIHQEIWSPHLAGISRHVRRPDRETTALQLIDNPDDEIWFHGEFDDINELVTAVFEQAFESAVSEAGQPGEQWEWGNRQNVRIDHIAQLPGFGKSGLAPGGTNLALNASRDGWGPSWRMIVDLSDPVSAWGTFPGGTSGNPGSYYYDNFVDQWESGELRELRFWRSTDEAEAAFTITLSEQ